MVKRDTEIEDIRRACSITHQCFTEILPFLKPGVTEQFVARQLKRIFSRYHVKPAFVPIIAFGPHTSVVHYLTAASSSTTCRRDEIILLDFGVKVNGYCSDMTRMVFVGIPKKEWLTAYTTLLHVQEACLQKIRDNKQKSFSGAALDRFARSCIKKAGLPPYPHGLGHNVGRKIHELPRLSRKKPALITAGMVFTVEPGTYIEDDYGIRIEDTVVLKEDGLEILTKTPKVLLCI